jgi:hypothetical protein
MTTFPRSPKLLKGGIVLIDPDTSAVQQIIALQYNPDKLSRTLKGQTMGEDSDRSQALRLKGPPVETYKLDAEIDAADQLEFPDQNEEIKKNGITPLLSALETIVYPESSQLHVKGDRPDNPRMSSTSLGIQISAGKSKEAETLISCSKELVTQNQGIFHLLIHPITSGGQK